MKGFLNPDPTHNEMQKWARRQGISLAQTVAFTDGSKVQIEQALAANGLGAGIAKQGLMALATNDFEAATAELAQVASTLGHPISDFIVARGQAPGVFVTATHPTAEPAELAYLKLGSGPFYTLVRPYHLCALEIPKTIRRVMAGRPPLLDNSVAPTIGVAAVAKRTLTVGETIVTGTGSFQVRGCAVRFADTADHVPIGLLRHATVTRPVQRGQLVTIDDVDLPPSKAVDLALGLLQASYDADHSG